VPIAKSGKAAGFPGVPVNPIVFTTEAPAAGFGAGQPGAGTLVAGVGKL